MCLPCTLKIALTIVDLFAFPFRVDFFIPGVSVVGGFSICSSPRLLEQERMIELAVKHTNHPPALWIHNQVSKPLFKLGDLGSLPLAKFSSLNPPKEPRLGCKGYTLTESSLPSRIRFQKGYRSSIFVYFLLFGRATWRVGSQLANQGQNLHPTQWRMGS